MLILLEKSEWIKTSILSLFYNKLKYYEFTKISKFEILFYNKIFLIEIRKAKKENPNLSCRKENKNLKRIRKNRKKKIWKPKSDQKRKGISDSTFVGLIVNFEMVYYTPKTNIYNLSYDLQKILCSQYATILHQKFLFEQEWNRLSMLAPKAIVLTNRAKLISK